jgi:hypothetical protein
MHKLKWETNTQDFCNVEYKQRVMRPFVYFLSLKITAVIYSMGLMGIVSFKNYFGSCKVF